jgi:hypothetical protein
MDKSNLRVVKPRLRMVTPEGYTFEEFREGTMVLYRQMHEQHLAVGRCRGSRGEPWYVRYVDSGQYNAHLLDRDILFAFNDICFHDTPGLRKADARCCRGFFSSLDEVPGSESWVH